MNNIIKIQFTRKNKNDVGIYTASSLMNNKIQMLYKWLYNKKRPINVLLTNVSHAFLAILIYFVNTKHFLK